MSPSSNFPSSTLKANQGDARLLAVGDNALAGRGGVAELRARLLKRGRHGRVRPTEIQVKTRLMRMWSRDVRGEPREGVVCGGKVARDLVARRSGRGLASEERFGDDADRALRAGHGLLHGLHTRSGRRVAVYDARQSHREKKEGPGWGDVHPGGVGHAAEGVLETSEVADDAEAVDVALEVTNLARGDGERGRWGDEQTVRIRMARVGGAPGEVRTGVDLRAGEEDEEGEESGDNVGEHGGW